MLRKTHTLAGAIRPRPRRRSQLCRAAFPGTPGNSSSSFLSQLAFRGTQTRFLFGPTAQRILFPCPNQFRRVMDSVLLSQPLDISALSAGGLFGSTEFQKVAQFHACLV